MTLVLLRYAFGIFPYPSVFLAFTVPVLQFFLLISHSHWNYFIYKLHIVVLYLIRSGCLYRTKRSRRSKCCSNSCLGDPNMERHITTSKEGCFSSQIGQWYTWWPDSNMQGNVVIRVTHAYLLKIGSGKMCVQYVMPLQKVTSTYWYIVYIHANAMIIWCSLQ